jgi:hypothetical protein
VRYYHESRKHGSPEDCVVLGGPVHDFEVDFFSSVVLTITKENVECYSTQWIVGTSWYDSVEGAVCWLQELQ